MSIALIVIAVIAVLLIVLLFSTVKIAREYERGVIFRLGRLLPEPKGPGSLPADPVHRPDGEGRPADGDPQRARRRR